jgi:hypothetical protein
MGIHTNGVPWLSGFVRASWYAVAQEEQGGEEQEEEEQVL